MVYRTRNHYISVTFSVVVVCSFFVSGVLLAFYEPTSTGLRLENIKGSTCYRTSEGYYCPEELGNICAVDSWFCLKVWLESTYTVLYHCIVIGGFPICLRYICYAAHFYRAKSNKPQKIYFRTENQPAPDALDKCEKILAPLLTCLMLCAIVTSAIVVPSVIVASTSHRESVKYPGIKQLPSSQCIIFTDAEENIFCYTSAYLGKTDSVVADCLNYILWFLNLSAKALTVLIFCWNGIRIIELVKEADREETTTEALVDKDVTCVHIDSAKCTSYVSGDVYPATRCNNGEQHEGDRQTTA